MSFVKLHVYVLTSVKKKLLSCKTLTLNVKELKKIFVIR